MSNNILNDISKVYLEQVVAADEAYQPIGKEQETAMYRRAGNLARTSLASKGKAKLAAAKKSATIVGAITRQKEKERFDSIGQSPSHNEEAKPDYLDFDKDGNKKESMKKALRDKKKVDEATVDPIDADHPNDPIDTKFKTKRLPNGRTPKPTPQEVSAIAAALKLRARAKSSRKVDEANDGNLANNYPPYDKVTRGDVIAGRLGKDQMGGKKKVAKEEFSNWREDLREVMSSIEKKDNDVKITEKKVDNKIKTSAMGGGIKLGEAIENLGGTLLEMEEIDERTLTPAETKKKEEIVMSMKKNLAGFKQRYGERAKDVMYATATKQAKKVAEQAMELQPKTQQQTQPEKPNPALAAKQKQAVAIQKQIEMKKIQMLNKGIPLTQSYELEGEVIDERRRAEKGTPRKPRNPAFELVAKSMGTGRMGVQPRGVKKEKGAPTPGPVQTPAKKVEMRRAAAQRAQDMMHSPRD